MRSRGFRRALRFLKRVRERRSVEKGRRFLPQEKSTPVYARRVEHVSVPAIAIGAPHPVDDGFKVRLQAVAGWHLVKRARVDIAVGIDVQEKLPGPQAAAAAPPAQYLLSPV